MTAVKVFSHAMDGCWYAMPDLLPENDAIPCGEWPFKLQIAGVDYELPSQFNKIAPGHAPACTICTKQLMCLMAPEVRTSTYSGYVHEVAMKDLRV